MEKNVCIFYGVHYRCVCVSADGCYLSVFMNNTTSPVANGMPGSHRQFLHHTNTTICQEAFFHAKQNTAQWESDIGCILWVYSFT